MYFDFLQVRGEINEKHPKDGKHQTRSHQLPARPFPSYLELLQNKFYFLRRERDSGARRTYHHRPYQFLSERTTHQQHTALCTSSNRDVSVAIDNKDHLSSILQELKKYAHILVEDRMSIVSVVGNLKWQYAGFEALIIQAIKEIPLRMISYGSNSNDVAVVIKDTDKKKALQALSDHIFQPVYTPQQAKAEIFA